MSSSSSITASGGSVVLVSEGTVSALWKEHFLATSNRNKNVCVMFAYYNADIQTEHINSHIIYSSEYFMVNSFTWLAVVH